MQRVGVIRGEGTVLAGERTFENVRYELEVIERNSRRTVNKGAIDASRDLRVSVRDAGGAYIELAGGLGWFGFEMTDVDGGGIQILGPAR